MNGVTHLGIIAGGAALLSTTPFDSRHERAERASWAEAEKMLRGWRAVRPSDPMEIVPLQRRSYDGWEAAKK